MKKQQLHGLVRNLRGLLALGGFKLTTWLSSSDKVMGIIPEEESKAAKSEMPSMTPQSPVLGISWDVTIDEFFFTTDSPDSPVTKRGILAITNSLRPSGIGSTSRIVNQTFVQ